MDSTPAHPTPLAPTYRWRLRKPEGEKAMDWTPAVHPIVARILCGRGLVEPAQIRAFLDHAPGTDDPFRMAGVQEAVARLRSALAAEEQIVVYGDFDADGVTATATLVEALGSLGARVRPFIPHRQRDGYGVHSEALRRLAAEGARVVVTVDCGIRAGDEVAAASKMGLDVIVTDHHALPASLPGAVAVINPRRDDCPYPYVDLAGVGLAYKLAQALLLAEARQPQRRGRPVAAETLLDLVALGTVADVVPLTGENRSLVHRGVARLREGHRVGVRALATLADLDLTSLSARDIAFVLGPRLNAVGRMDSADPALQLLLTNDPAEASRLAGVLERSNQMRRTATEAAIDAAEAAVAEDVTAPFILHADPDVELGVTGLVAGRLASRHYRPTAVLRLEEDTARGSARSIPEFDLIAALDEESHRLVRYGGHAMAAGFTVARDGLADLHAALLAHAARALEGVDLRPALDIDAEVAPADLSWHLYEGLTALEPYGEANPRPLLAVRGATVRSPRVVGRKHLRLTIGGAPDGPLDAIAFGQGNRLASLGDRVDLAGTLRVNTWGGGARLEMVVEDLAQASEAPIAEPTVSSR